MSAACWLVVRELRARWRRVALAAAAVAALVGAATAMELLARAREDAVAARLDRMGPALTLVPDGATAGALARGELDGSALPGDAAERVARELGSDLRRTEARLFLSSTVGGVPTLVIGADDADRVLLGAELVARLGSAGEVVIDGESFSVAGVRTVTGGLEDVAVTLPLATAAQLRGAPGPLNALRIYLRPGSDPVDSERRLGAAGVGAAGVGGAVVRHDRGEVAARELPDALARHRGAAYVLFATAAALCLLIVAHLDASERRIEIATLVAIGAPRAAIVGSLVGRSILVAIAGAVIGVGVGFSLAAGQDIATIGTLVHHVSVFVTPVVTAGALAAVATAPTAVVAVLRDPVPTLQEA